MGAKLKPCPFCGENKHEYYVEEELMGLRIRGDAFKQKLDFECWVVECLTCDTSGPGDISQRLAIKKWNKRAETTKLEARVRELESGIREARGKDRWTEKTHPLRDVFKVIDNIIDNHITLSNSNELLRLYIKYVKQFCGFEKGPGLSPPESGEK